MRRSLEMAAGEAGNQLGGAAPIHLTRRRFLGGALAASALVLGATTAPAHLWAQALDASDDPLAGMAFHPGVWLGLEPSGRLTIMAARSEMGTGIRTALPRVLADEMEADWAQVRVVQAIGDRAYGSQDTDGSHSIRSFFNVMRSAGAAA
ncbi:MAG: molybdopterin cofactor-binding domain-containing protein, partial [Terriglobales bacterium]